MKLSPSKIKELRKSRPSRDQIEQLVSMFTQKQKERFYKKLECLKGEDIGDSSELRNSTNNNSIHSADSLNNFIAASENEISVDMQLLIDAENCFQFTETLKGVWSKISAPGNRDQIHSEETPLLKTKPSIKTSLAQKQNPVLNPNIQKSLHMPFHKKIKVDKYFASPVKICKPQDKKTILLKTDETNIEINSTSNNNEKKIDNNKLNHKDNCIIDLSHNVITESFSSLNKNEDSSLDVTESFSKELLEKITFKHFEENKNNFKFSLQSPVLKKNFQNSQLDYIKKFFEKEPSQSKDVKEFLEFEDKKNFDFLNLNLNKNIKKIFKWLDYYNEGGKRLKEQENSKSCTKTSLEGFLEINLSSSHLYDVEFSNRDSDEREKEDLSKERNGVQEISKADKSIFLDEIEVVFSSDSDSGGEKTSPVNFRECYENSCEKGEVSYVMKGGE